MRTSSRLLSCLLLAAVAGAGHAAPATRKVVERYVEAINRGDVESALATFTDDATLVAGPDCTPQNPCVGKAQIRARFMEPMVAQHLRLHPVSFEYGPQRLRVVLALQLDEFRQLGFDRLRGVDEIRLRDGRIASVMFRFDPDHRPTARFLEMIAAPPRSAAARD